MHLLLKCNGGIIPIFGCNTYLVLKLPSNSLHCWSNWYYYVDYQDYNKCYYESNYQSNLMTGKTSCCRNLYKSLFDIALFTEGPDMITTAWFITNLYSTIAIGKAPCAFFNIKRLLRLSPKSSVELDFILVTVLGLQWTLIAIGYIVFVGIRKRECALWTGDALGNFTTSPLEWFTNLTLSNLNNDTQ